jgi:hypothetical protein
MRREFDRGALSDSATRTGELAQGTRDALAAHRAKSPLRVGLLLDGLRQPEWVARAIRELAESSAARIALIVLNDAPWQRPRRLGRMRAWIRNRHYLLYSLYQRIDRWWFKVSNDPFSPVDLTDDLRDVPVLRVRPRMTKHCDYFESEDVDAIRRYDLDVAVRFGFRILKGDALDIARHGVWSYHHGDNLVNRGGPAGFWEVMDDSNVTGCVLQRLTESLDDGRVLYRCFSSTNRFSVAKNLAGFYWASSLLLRRVMEDLHGQGPDTFFAGLESAEPWRGYSNRLATAPRNVQMARLIVRLARRYAVERFHRFFEFEQWFVAYGLRATPAAERFAPDTSYYRFRELIPPRDRFWADPFAVEYRGSRFIFIEEYLFATDRGRISLFEIDASGVAHGPTPVLEREYHLSYPFVFEWGGTHYMIPETHKREQIELFRATEFPHRWAFDRVLISNVRAVDTTLAEFNGRWWLFTSIASGPDQPWEELSIFYADSPVGPWIPHHRNPVKSDVRSSRPAGRLFHWRGKLYRPAQDCARRYGHSIVVNQVEHLDPDAFVEREVSRITPGWTRDLLATHTLNADGSLTVIDGQRWRRKGRP